MGFRYRAGAAYVFFGRAVGAFAATYDLKSSDVVDGKTAASILGLRAESALGIGVGPAGDLNGDGVSDVWVSTKRVCSCVLIYHFTVVYAVLMDRTGPCLRNFEREI